MLDFTTAPEHLMTPLSVDTNIDYTLDMTKFPGLNSEECNREFALLPSTSSASASEGPRVCELCGNLLPYQIDNTVPCGFCVYYGLIEADTNGAVDEKDSNELFSLIASCDMDAELDTISSGELQSVLEDIIESTSSSTSLPSSLSSTQTADLTVSPLPKLSPLSPVESCDLESFISATSETNISSVCETAYGFCVDEINAMHKLDVSYDDIFTDSTCVPDILEMDDTPFSPVMYDTSIRKRKLSIDSDNKVNKRPRSSDIDDILLNCFVDFSHVSGVYSSDKAEVMSRES